MRFVLDSNVLISSLLVPAGKSRQALDHARAKGHILVSLSLLVEISNVLTRPKFRSYIDESDAQDFVAALAREAEWIEANTIVTACRDPKDNMILELAVSGNATHIVSGDNDLLVLSPFQGIPIMSPKDFLKL